MKKSDFKFSNPILLKTNFLVNKEFKNNENVVIDNSFNVSINRDESSNIAIVELTIEVGREELKTDVPFYIELVIGSAFSWDDVFDKNTLQTLLSQNAPALLLSYARPIIHSLTSMTPFPAYNVPFYNFTEK